MSVDVGWVALIFGFLGFVGFLVILSVLYVFWKDLWGGHDE